MTAETAYQITAMTSGFLAAAPAILAMCVMIHDRIKPLGWPKRIAIGTGVLVVGVAIEHAVQFVVAGFVLALLVRL